MIAWCLFPRGFCYLRNVCTLHSAIVNFFSPIDEPKPISVIVLIKLEILLILLSRKLLLFYSPSNLWARPGPSFISTDSNKNSITRSSRHLRLRVRIIHNVAVSIFVSTNPNELNSLIAHVLLLQQLIFRYSYLFHLLSPYHLGIITDTMYTTEYIKPVVPNPPHFPIFESSSSIRDSICHYTRDKSNNYVTSSRPKLTYVIT